MCELVPPDVWLLRWRQVLQPLFCMPSSWY